MSRFNQLPSATELFGVPAKARNARDRLVQRTVDLCYHQGFNAIGIDRIIAEAGVTKTTFYKYFESKDHLLLEAVRTRDEWEARAWSKAIRRIGGRDARAQLLAAFDVLDIWFNDARFNGCLFINVAAEFPNPHDPIHQAAAQHKLRTRDFFRDLARKAGATDPETFADLYTLQFEGTLIMRQVYGRNEAARLARTAVEGLLERFCPAPARSDSPA